MEVLGAAEMLGAAERFGVIDTNEPSEGAPVGPLEVLGTSLGAPVGRPPTDGAAEVLGAAEVMGAMGAMCALNAEGLAEGATVGPLERLGTALGPTGWRGGRAWAVGGRAQRQQAWTFQGDEAGSSGDGRAHGPLRGGPA